MAETKGPWGIGAKEYISDLVVSPRKDDIPDCPPISTQQLGFTVEAVAYKLNKAKGHGTMEWYRLSGSVRSAIRHNDDSYKDGPSPWWLAVGYYCDKMWLQIDCTTPHAIVYQSGPGTTVGTESSSFNIGGGLNAMVGDMSGVGASISAGFSESYSTPAVTIANSTMGSSVRWDVALPGVGFGSDPNPKPPSYVGYQWPFGIIFQLPTEDPPTFQFQAICEFGYDNPRGTRYDTLGLGIANPTLGTWTPFS